METEHTTSQGRYLTRWGYLTDKELNALAEDGWRIIQSEIWPIGQVKADAKPSEFVFFTRFERFYTPKVEDTLTEQQKHHLKKLGYVPEQLYGWEEECYRVALNTRAVRALRTSHVRPIYLFEMTDEQLLKVRGVGPLIVSQIREAMPVIKAKYEELKR